MLSSLRARVICALILLVISSVLISTAANYLIARKGLNAATDDDLASAVDQHATVIGDWLAGKSKMIASLEDITLTNDPDAMLKQI